MTIVANTAFSDVLLIRMGFQTEQFAYAKSAMFLAPAICYQLAAAYLQSLNRDKLICIWCYGLRVAVPLLLPVMALVTENRTVLFWTALFVFGFGYTMAAFANNTLSVLYKKVLPPGEYSRYSSMMFLIFSGPATISALLMAHVLDRWTHYSNRRFFVMFTILEIAMMLFEIPAILSLLRLKVESSAKAFHFSFRDYLAPLLDKIYRKFLIFMILRHFFYGMLTCYLVVYFLKIARFTNFRLTLTTLGMSLLGMGLSTVLGKYLDRFGYRVWLAILTTFMLVIGVAFPIWPQLLLFQFLFLCLVGDGNSSLGSTLAVFMEQTASTKFARLKSVNMYVAASNLIGNLATFLACILGGCWYGFLEHHMPGSNGEVFHMYFQSCNLFLLGILALLLFGGEWKTPSNE
ncbi:MAG: MFS transporter [Victivallales bacterium]|nr:MFS transporter [Victivallales bacterium]